MKSLKHSIFPAETGRSNGKAESGFSLTEAMVTICIIAIGLLAIGSMQNAAFKGNTTARYTTEETEKAVDTLEKLRGLPYDDELLEDKNGDGVDGLDNMYPTGGGGEYSSPADYADTSGELGYFQHRFQVYDREGEPCASAGCANAVHRIVQSGRSTFFCPSCQR